MIPKVLHSLLLVLTVLTTFVMSPPVFAAEGVDDDKDSDPWIGLNQRVFAFNETADRWVLKPVAKTYVSVVPAFARQNVGNVFSNLGDVRNGVNNLLQGKPLKSLIDVGRILINSSLGLAGLFDPASGIGLTKHNESFGQTLSVWGVPKGPYLVLPLLGPSTLTDLIARRLDSPLDPLRYLHPVDHRNRTFGLRIVDQRASVLAAERLVFGDRYVFLRDAYLQRRNYLVNDGVVEDSFEEF
jgi:phospholipid-binding lipoprotein MlaA